MRDDSVGVLRVLVALLRQSGHNKDGAESVPVISSPDALDSAIMPTVLPLVPFGKLVLTALLDIVTFSRFKAGSAGCTLLDGLPAVPLL